MHSLEAIRGVKEEIISPVWQELESVNILHWGKATMTWTQVTDSEKGAQPGKKPLRFTAESC